MIEKINIEKAIKNFIYYLEFEENKKNNTVISIKKDLNQFLEYLNRKNITTLDKLDELVIKEYLVELKAVDLSNSTYNRRLSSIKKFYKYLINNNLKENGKEHNLEEVEQIIRPTGLLDPLIEVRKTEGQIDDIIGEVNSVIKKGERVLITTLTKKMAENLTDYLKNVGIKTTYLHSDIDTIERMEIIFLLVIK